MRPQPTSPEHLLALARQVLGIEADALRVLSTRLDAGFADAVQLILACRGRVSLEVGHEDERDRRILGPQVAHEPVQQGDPCAAFLEEDRPELGRIVDHRKGDRGQASLRLVELDGRLEKTDADLEPVKRRIEKKQKPH